MPVLGSARPPRRRAIAGWRHREWGRRRRGRDDRAAGSPAAAPGALAPPEQPGAGSLCAGGGRHGLRPSTAAAICRRRPPPPPPPPAARRVGPCRGRQGRRPRPRPRLAEVPGIGRDRHLCRFGRNATRALELYARLMYRFEPSRVARSMSPEWGGKPSTCIQRGRHGIAFSCQVLIGCVSPQQSSMEHNTSWRARNRAWGHGDTLDGVVEAQELKVRARFPAVRYNHLRRCPEPRRRRRAGAPCGSRKL